MGSKRSVAFHTQTELLEVLHFDLQQIILSPIETIDRLFDETFASDRNLPLIRSFARESVVNVPALIDEDSPLGHLVIRSNERLESLIEQVKEQAWIFIENAEKCRSWIDLNPLAKGVDWRNELIQMQGEISADQMKIRDYFRERSDLATKILHQPRISDHWMALFELDEDFFFRLRWILHRLRSFSRRLTEMLLTRDIYVDRLDSFAV